jgi:hypothetical protein
MNMDQKKNNLNNLIIDNNNDQKMKKKLKKDPKNNEKKSGKNIGDINSNEDNMSVGVYVYVFMCVRFI